MATDEQKRAREEAATRYNIERHMERELRNIERIQRQQNRPRST